MKNIKLAQYLFSNIFSIYNILGAVNSNLSNVEAKIERTYDSNIILKSNDAFWDLPIGTYKLFGVSPSGFPTELSQGKLLYGTINVSYVDNYRFIIGLVTNNIASESKMLVALNMDATYYTYKLL